MKNNHKAKLVVVLVIGLFFSSGILTQISMNNNFIVKADDAPFGTVTLINEGFEGATWPPTGWTSNAYFWYQGPLFGAPSHSGDHHAYSFSDDDSMVTPILGFQYDSELTFWYAAESSSYTQGLEIYVDGTDLIWSDNSITNTNYIEVILDLGSYYGDHTVEFYNSMGTSLYGLLVDDVLITTDTDTSPPVIIYIEAQPAIQVIDGDVEITCDVTDDHGVDEVYVNITFPDTSLHSYPMTPTFGDYSHEQQYTIAGIYDYTIWAIDINGNSISSPIHQFEINNPPTADFSFIPVSPSTADTVDFTDLSIDSDGTVVSWDWDFGDGGSSTSQDPSHSYSDDGTYTVMLTVEDDDGATDFTTQLISVTNVGPTADFTYLPEHPTIFNTIDFTDTSIDSDGTVVSWDWDFGDGNTSNLQDPSHNYPVLGDYDVSLTVTDDDGAIDTIEIVLSVAGPEILDINQSIFNRGFRLMPGWDAAQEFIPSFSVLSSVDLYLSKFGSPTGDITFQICEDSADGIVVYEGEISPGDVPSYPSYEWIKIDISDIAVTPGETYYIVLKDATGADSHNCIQWGWCDSFASGSGGPYSGGWFWFRKEANPTWSPIRDWDYTVKTYGFD